LAGRITPYVGDVDRGLTVAIVRTIGGPIFLYQKIGFLRPEVADELEADGRASELRPQGALMAATDEAFIFGRNFLGGLQQPGLGGVDRIKGSDIALAGGGEVVDALEHYRVCG
jgi:hypothetical protein